MGSGPVARDLTGQKFGRLTAKALSHFRGAKPSRYSFWLCACSCGKEVTVRTQHLRDGRTRSCGCINTPTVKARQVQVLNNYKHHAKDRKLLFELSFEQFISITQNSCHYCGDAPRNKAVYISRGQGSAEFFYNGIDRVDNALGYTLDNCVPCCGACNTAKSDMSSQQFINLCQRVSARHS